MPSEAEIQNAILLQFGSRQDLKIWRSNTGAAVDRSGRVVRFGVRGAADISGIIMGTGRRLEIEVKSAIGRLSEEQKLFGDMIKRFGGLYVVARSCKDVEEALLTG